MGSVLTIVVSGPQATGKTTLAVAATIRHYQPDAEAGFVADAMPPVADLVAGVLAIAADGTTPQQPGRPDEPGP